MDCSARHFDLLRTAHSLMNMCTNDDTVKAGASSTKHTITMHKSLLNKNVFNLMHKCTTPQYPSITAALFRAVLTWICYACTTHSHTYKQDQTRPEGHTLRIYSITHRLVCVYCRRVGSNTNSNSWQMIFRKDEAALFGVSHFENAD